MLSLVGNMFLLMRKIVSTRKIYVFIMGKINLQTKVCVSVNRKYVSTTEKNSFYRQKYVFRLVGIMFPQLGKIVSLSKLCVSTSGSVPPLAGK